MVCLLDVEEKEALLQGRGRRKSLLASVSIVLQAPKAWTYQPLPLMSVDQQVDLNSLMSIVPLHVLSNAIAMANKEVEKVLAEEKSKGKNCGTVRGEKQVSFG